jgi:GNAT superfamily N-acetyltransferase
MLVIQRIAIVGAHKTTIVILPFYFNIPIHFSINNSMRYKEFTSHQENVQKITKPWNPEIIDGIYQCFERNFGFERTVLRDEMDWPDFLPDPEPSDIEIFVIIAKDDNLLSETVDPKWVKGFYILRRLNIDAVFNPEEYPAIKKWKGNGIQGVALALDKEFRNTGVGKQLISVPYTMNVDYIWGLHLAKLHNIDHWLKRRELVMTVEDPDSGTVFVTATKIK